LFILSFPTGNEKDHFPTSDCLAEVGASPTMGSITLFPNTGWAGLEWEAYRKVAS